MKSINLLPFLTSQPAVDPTKISAFNPPNTAVTSFNWISCCLMWWEVQTNTRLHTNTRSHATKRICIDCQGDLLRLAIETTTAVASNWLTRLTGLTFLNASKGVTVGGKKFITQCVEGVAHGSNTRLTTYNRDNRWACKNNSEANNASQWYYQAFACNTQRYTHTTIQNAY